MRIHARASRARVDETLRASTFARTLPDVRPHRGRTVTLPSLRPLRTCPVSLSAGHVTRPRVTWRGDTREETRVLRTRVNERAVDEYLTVVPRLWRGATCTLTACLLRPETEEACVSLDSEETRAFTRALTRVSV